MIQCQKCKKDIPNDSWYCDQCGEQLLFCPKCADGRPRRGKRCTQCGSLLVDGNKWVNGATTPAPTPTQAPAPAPTPVQEPVQTAVPKPTPTPTPTPTQTQAPKTNTAKQSNELNFDDFAKQWDTIFQQNSSTNTQPQQQAGATQRSQSQAGGTMRTPNAPNAALRLVMIDDPSKVITLKDKAILGRTTGDYTDILGNCPYVSSKHGKITYQLLIGAWFYSDLGSTNGSLLNNTMLEPNKYYELRKGMIFEIGNVKFRVE